jgi:hypothetical protein
MTELTGGVTLPSALKTHRKAIFVVTALGAYMAALARIICTGLSRAKITNSTHSSAELNVVKAHGFEAMLDGEMVDGPFAFLKPHDAEPK